MVTEREAKKKTKRSRRCNQRKKRESTKKHNETTQKNNNNTTSDPQNKASAIIYLVFSLTPTNYFRISFQNTFLDVIFLYLFHFIFFVSYCRFVVVVVIIVELRVFLPSANKNVMKKMTSESKVILKTKEKQAIMKKTKLKKKKKKRRQRKF